MDFFLSGERAIPAHHLPLLGTVSLPYPSHCDLHFLIRLHLPGHSPEVVTWPKLSQSECFPENFVFVVQLKLGKKSQHLWVKCVKWGSGPLGSPVFTGEVWEGNVQWKAEIRGHSAGIWVRCLWNPRVPPALPAGKWDTQIDFNWFSFLPKWAPVCLLSEATPKSPIDID